MEREKDDELDANIEEMWKHMGCHSPGMEKANSSRRTEEENRMKEAKKCKTEAEMKWMKYKMEAEMEAEMKWMKAECVKAAMAFANECVMAVKAEEEEKKEEQNRKYKKFMEDIWSVVGKQVLVNPLQIDMLEMMGDETVKRVRCMASRWKRILDADTATREFVENERAEEEVNYYIKNRIPPFDDGGWRRSRAWEDDSD